MDELKRMDRRVAIKWVLAASATLSLLDFRSFGATPSAKGYGTDPNLLEFYRPGDLWPLTFTKEQHRTATVLCDLIIPADDRSPSAGSLGVADFIDEWISAPYPEQEGDRKIIVSGLAWLDTESQKRFQKPFADADEAGQREMCDDICSPSKAKAEFNEAAHFFSKFRNLTAGGFYTTPQGWKDIGYVGNVALTKFDGPPPEVLKHLGL